MSSPSSQSKHNEAIENVREARQLLQTLREELDRHPQLEEAIVKLELALENLTLKSGGML
jgi:predicted component of type VI protein secretion system